jgi:hypothetical protein
MSPLNPNFNRGRLRLPEPEKILRLRIELDRIAPPIWRTFEVASNWTFATLHDVIQVVMGWENDHLHEFRTKKKPIVKALEIVPGEEEFEDEVRLDAHLKRVRTKLKYVYDFGDGWSHTIVVEAITKPEPGVRYPRLLAGERACPPEDCGGPWGYRIMLDILADPTDEEYEEKLEWVGGDFDPEAFDVEERNKKLARIGP